MGLGELLSSVVRRTSGVAPVLLSLADILVPQVRIRGDEGRHHL
jgi:hypothetical protein